MDKTINDPTLLRICAALAVLGTIALIVGNVWGSIVVPNHDWVADTVSDLAAGPYEIIQDVALYGYAAALLALALASAHLHEGSRGWNIMTFGLALTAVAVVIIGARNEYGDGDADGIVVHIYIVYALGLLFALIFWTAGLSSTLPEINTVSRACAVLWTLGAPIFFVLPTGIDGAYERGLGIVTAIWVVTYARVILRLSDPD